MDSIDYHLLDPRLRKSQVPSLKQWLIGASLLILLLALILRFSLQDSIANYQHLGVKLKNQLLKLEQQAHSKKTSSRLKLQQQRALYLLNLIATHLNTDLFLTELQINEQGLLVKGQASSTEAVKHYAEAFASHLSLEDFSFTHGLEQNIEFTLRFADS